MKCVRREQYKLPLIRSLVTLAVYEADLEADTSIILHWPIAKGRWTAPSLAIPTFHRSTKHNGWGSPEFSFN